MNKRLAACVDLSIMPFALRGIAALALLLPVASAGALDRSTWDVTLETSALGPIVTRLRFERSGEGLRALSASGALDVIRRLGDASGNRPEWKDALFAMRLSRAQAAHEGHVTAPFQEGTVRLAVEGDRLSGTIEGGLFQGKFSGKRTSVREPLRDYPAIWRNIESTLQANIYDRQALRHLEYLHFAELLAAASESAIDDMDLLLAFRLSWNNTAFSHFQLRRSSVSAESTVRSLDRLRVGYDAARVDFDGDMAWLTVDTMMGNDTIEQIEAAYRAIDKAESKALVIDLRNNSGGAFAVKPLVEHVIDEPLDAGHFVGQKWSNREAPNGAELTSIEPWTGWSIRAFWHAVQQDGLVKLRFTPAEPHFGGRVYVLVSRRTASAAELAVDALRSSARATIIGEQTAGEMLSQSMYDAGGGFLVSLPIADYFSSKHGRIEGVGVPADIEVQAADAAETARSLHFQAN